MKFVVGEPYVHRSKLDPPMSALGHSRPSHFVPVLNNVRYASDSDHSRYESELTLWAKSDCEQEQTPRLFDHLVGSGEQSWRNGQAKRFGGFEVDDKIEFGRLFDRNIGRLAPPQNSAITASR